MKPIFCVLGLLLPAVIGKTPSTSLGELPTDRPLVIAHRGSSGQLPQHTVEAYKLAVEQGADMIECQLAVTKDRKLVCSHGPMLSHTTDVKSRPEFADRRKTYLIPSTLQRVTDFFTIDFTLDELKTLRKIQQLSFRDQSYNGKFQMASLEECIAVAQNSSNRKTVGIYTETKLPGFFNRFLEPSDTTFEAILVEVLENHGYNSKTSPCLIQSFDITSIQRLTNLTDLRLVFLLENDIPDSQMRSISSYVSGIGQWKSVIITVNTTTNLIMQRTNFTQRAHSFGFKVHSYTFRNEYQYLAKDYGADPYKEYEDFINLGVDGMFTDFPASLVNYLDLTTPEEKECPTNRGVNVKNNMSSGLLLAFVVARQYIF